MPGAEPFLLDRRTELKSSDVKLEEIKSNLISGAGGNPSNGGRGQPLKDH